MSPLLILFLSSVVIFLPFFWQINFLVLNPHDIAETYFPLYQFYRESLFNNRVLPFWRDSIFSGMPFVSDPLSAWIYPPNILFFLFPINLSINLYIYLHFFLALVFVYLLTHKGFKFPPSASILAAFIYALSPKMIGHLGAGHITMLASFSWFPLAFLGARLLVKNGGWGGVFLLALSLAFMLFTYPTIFFWGILAIFSYLLWQTLLKRDFKIILRFFLSVVWFLFLSAIFLLPSLDFSSYTTRTLLTLDDVALPLWSIKRFAQAFLFPYPALTQIDHEAILYLGILPSLLAFWGFWKLSRRNQIIILVAVSIVTLVALGRRTPFFPALYQFLPLLSLTRITTRLWFLVILLASFLSALALSRVKNQKIIIFVLILALFEFLLIGFLRLSAIARETPQFNQNSYRFLSQNSQGYRIYCTTHCSQYQAAIDNLKLVDGEAPIQLFSYINFLSQAGGYQWPKFAVIFPPYQVWQTASPAQPNAELLGLLSAKYVVSPYPLTDVNFSQVGQFGQMTVYENLKVLPPVWIEKDGERIEVKDFHKTPNKIEVLVPEGVKGTLVLSEVYYSGWQAKSLGRPLEIKPYQDILRSVALLGEEKEIIFSFHPRFLKEGAILSFLGLLFALVMAILPFGRRR